MSLELVRYLADKWEGALLVKNGEAALPLHRRPRAGPWMSCGAWVNKSAPDLLVPDKGGRLPAGVAGAPRRFGVAAVEDWRVVDALNAAAAKLSWLGLAQ